MKNLHSLFATTLVAASSVCTTSGAFALDDGTQANDPFRVNFVGYLTKADKTALYLSENVGPIKWSLTGTSCEGTEDTYVENDFASGDSFYIIDFSKCQEPGTELSLRIGDTVSPKFDIGADPYGKLKYEFFDYYKDHETKSTFDQAVNQWTDDISLTFSYVRDAGDNGAYPVNTAEAAWSIINLLETYPDINTYYSENIEGGYTVYKQLKILTEQFYYVFGHGGKLAIPKFHTNVNDSWALCPPFTSGTCISEPETKATFAAARTLAAMARVHIRYGEKDQANDAYKRARQALKNAQSEPLKCNQEGNFGGEGGMYPDNDTYGLWRFPKTNRDNCWPDKNNTEDDEYSALVEAYLAALKLKKSGDAKAYKKAVLAHPRFDEVSSFWWGEVAMEGSLSLLTNESLHDINLSNLKSNILVKANEILGFQSVGYPGVTFDAKSDRWDNGDYDDVDNNFRWGSNRMALNDARILMVAAEIERGQKNMESAATYANGAIKVLDHMSGINAVNLAMYTAGEYSNIENAVTRTHDKADETNQWPGKMVLGPNNWTNANDPDMPAFGSLPGLKMFAPTGTGWASREISIDANASLLPVAYFTTEIAPAILDFAPEGGGPVSGQLDCTFKVTNDWGNGFNALISLTNTSNTPVNDWKVSWEFENGVKILGTWNADVSGTGAGPFSASNLNWNSAIAPGATVSFGMTVGYSGGKLPEPKVSGLNCQ